MRPATSEISFPKIENQVLCHWESNQTFYKQVAKHKDKTEYTFYDGPPFANGLPHYGHLLACTIKDTVPRYWSMRGYHVERRFGWDCHGVPVEFEIEKREGIKGRDDILEMGVGTFNEKCRESVLHYTKEWQHTITRMGRWVDWNDQYRTMDKDFMESVWWVFSQLYEKGFVYKGFKVVPYSPRITAVLSNFEANQNYKDVQDPAITVKFKLKDEDAFLLAWTTTPWTLISNLALCVGPSVAYVKVKDKESGENYYLAKARLDYIYKKNQEGYEILQELGAAELVGKAYEPLFPYFHSHENAFVVLQDDYVSTDDGTGVVHQAPAYGEDDFRIVSGANIELVDPVDEEGRFKAEIAEYAGRFVKDCDKDIIKRLKDESKLVKQDVIVHSYPFCERTDTPLIYKAIETWYVAVEKIKEQMIANNKTINWVPGHLRDGRMGKWLENARDWAISRNRFWGTPIPIWVSDKDANVIEVIGSVEELEAKTGEKVADLHIHNIDHLTWKCEKTGGTMRRIAEVFDCWFESGSMPYAQRHYPFEGRDAFEKAFPADFIAEGLDQTRGWFYTLNVLSTALFGKPAFKNVIVNGLVLAEDGKKMSKRLKNYTDPLNLVEKYGADSIRLYMLNSPVLKAGELCFSDKGVKDTTRAVLIPLLNAYSFLATYAQAESWSPIDASAKAPPASDNVLDQWVISRFQTLCARVEDEMEQYRLFAVVNPVLDFIEELTNWYIRLSRKRFWGTGSGLDKQAFETLYYVLVNFSKVFAPFAPFISDHLFSSLTENSEEDSVHLCDMPLKNLELQNLVVEDGMKKLRLATDLGRSLRAKHQIRTRQPLRRLLVITRNEQDAEFVMAQRLILESELNVKEIQFTTDEAKHVNLSVKPNLKLLGKKLGKTLNAMRQEMNVLNEDPRKVADLLDQLQQNGSVEVCGQSLVEEEFLIERSSKDGGSIVASQGGVTVILDTEIDAELLNEGYAREIVNRVQKLRKDSELQVSDRISLRVQADSELHAALKHHEQYVAGEVLAKKLEVVDALGEVAYSAESEIDGKLCKIGFSIC